jgi:hypothetical protein
VRRRSEEDEKGGGVRWCEVLEFEVVDVHHLIYN